MVRPRSLPQFRRCSLKPPLRTKSVGTKVSEGEFALLEERARGAGLTLGEWVRDVLLAAPVEPGPEAAEVALAEVLALRSLLLNLRTVEYESVANEVNCIFHTAGSLLGSRCPESWPPAKRADQWIDMFSDVVSAPIYSSVRDPACSIRSRGL